MQWFCGVVRCELLSSVRGPSEVVGNKHSVLACLGNMDAVQKACHSAANLHNIRHLSRCTLIRLQAEPATGVQT